MLKLAAVARLKLETWLIICLLCFYWRFALLSVTAELWLQGLNIHNPDTLHSLKVYSYKRSDRDAVEAELVESKDESGFIHSCCQMKNC